MRVFPRVSLAVALVTAAWCATLPAAAGQSGSRLEGVVVDASGAVVSSAVVRLSSRSNERQVSSGSDGRWAFDAVAAGAYEVVATAPGFAPAHRSVRVGGRAESLTLTLVAGAFSDDVTVLATRLSPSDEARRRLPGAVDVLSAGELEASRVFSTSEALRKVPGVTVRDEEGLGLRPNLAVRGLNPTRSTKILLLEDGVPTVYAPYGDNASYYHPPIERFHRIEVLKGSSQIAYGPVTVGAVINYITPEPPARPSVVASLSGGNRDFVNATLGVGATWGRTGVQVSAMRKESAGARDNLFSTLDDFSAKLTHQLTPVHGLAAKVGYYGEDSQVTYSGLRQDEYALNPRQNPFANDRFDGRRIGGSVAYRGLLGGRVAWTTTGYASGFDRDWWRQSSNSAQRPNDAADPACAGMANLLTTCGNEGRLRSYRSGGVESRARLSLRTWGVEHEADAGFRFHVERQDRLQVNGDTPTARAGRLVEDNARETDAWSGFWQHHLRWSAATVTPGVRVEHVAYGRTNRLLGVTGETRLTQVLPGVGVSVAAGAHATLFAGVHRGFASPRAEDVINNGGGVVDLDPELGWNYEAGVRSKVARGVSADVTFFRLDYENQIVPASVAGGVGATLTNGGETLHQGLEAGLGADTADRLGADHALYARAALTWLPVARFTGSRLSTVPGFATVSVSGNRVPYASRGSATVTIGYRHRLGLDAQIEAQHAGDQFGDDLNTVPGSADGQRGLVPAFTYWNAAASWRLPLGGSVHVAVKNFLDRTFIVDRVRGILPGTPRLVQVGTTWRF